MLSSVKRHICRFTKGLISRAVLSIFFIHKNGEAGMFIILTQWVRGGVQAVIVSCVLSVVAFSQSSQDSVSAASHRSFSSVGFNAAVFRGWGCLSAII